MFHIASFYKFIEIDDRKRLKATITAVCEQHDVLGTILLAPEGINGTIAGTKIAVGAVLETLRADVRLRDLTAKHSQASASPFLRLKVRLKREIVALGVGEVDAAGNTGHRVPPEQWNDLITRPDVFVIDTRNDYEFEVGTFTGAVNPQTGSFTEFPDWIRENATAIDKPKIAMFCTGGIRCEKASAYLKDQGFDEVYQLDGGILRYLEAVPEPESTWVGECYVFDRRVTVGHGLTPGNKEICVNCNRVLAPDERGLDGYVEGVCCSRCADTITEDRRSRFAERQHQIELARRRGATHLGRV